MRSAQALLSGVPKSSSTLLTAVVLWLTVFFLADTVQLGAIAQVGLQHCAVCTGNTCTGSAICPASIVGLYVVTFFLGLESVLVGIILTARRAAMTRHWPVDGRGGSAPDSVNLLLYLIAPSLVLYGWALVVLGLVLPWNAFGFCMDGPCGYPWVLSGYPLALVQLGCMLLAGGAASFAIGYHRLRRDSGAVHQPLSAA